MSTNNVGPHDFRPLRWIDKHLACGRCSHCYVRRDRHPVHGWLPARPLGDRAWPSRPGYVPEGDRER